MKLGGNTKLRLSSLMGRELFVWQRKDEEEWASWSQENSMNWNGVWRVACSSSAFRLLPFISFIRSHDGCQESEDQPESSLSYIMYSRRNTSWKHLWNLLPSLLLQLFPFKVNETVVIVNKNEQKLADEIEAALEKLSKDGTLKKIFEKWYHRDLFDQLKN